MLFIKLALDLNLNHHIEFADFAAQRINLI